MTQRGGRPEVLSQLVANYLGPKPTPTPTDVQALFPRCRWCGLDVPEGDAVPAKGVENRVSHRKCEADHDALRRGA